MQWWFFHHAAMATTVNNAHHYVCQDERRWHSCHQYTLESLDYNLRNKNTIKIEIIHVLWYADSDPCSLKGQIYDPNLYGHVNHKSCFWNKSNNVMSATVFSSMHSLVMGAMICQSGGFLVIRMIPVVISAGIPHNIIPIFFTKTTEIFLLPCLLVWLVSGTSSFLLLAYRQLDIYCFLVFLLFFDFMSVLVAMRGFLSM